MATVLLRRTLVCVAVLAPLGVGFGMASYVGENPVLEHKHQHRGDEVHAGERPCSGAKRCTGGFGKGQVLFAMGTPCGATYNERE